MAVSVPGVISGINTSKLIQQLTQVYQAPIQQLKSQVAQEDSQLTAWGNFKSALSQLQSGLGGLSNINTLSQRSVTSSDTSVATASVTNDASPGSYSLSVSGLAQSQSLYSQSFASADQTAVGTGTLQIQVGSASPVSVSIDNSNNTLNGIAGAINSANAGVKAAVVYDGSGYRLTLTGDKTGAKNAFTVTTSGATGNLGALNYNGTTKNLTQSTAAQDASATVNGIAVTSSTNTLSGAVPGVTINLKSGGSATLSVKQDVSSVVGKVKGFVKAFNDTIKTINSLTKYDSSTHKAGPLLGNSEVQSIRTQLLNAVSGFGQGVPLSSQYNGLGSVGLTINKDGTLSLDAGKLSGALQNDFSAVAGFFGRVGSTTGNGIQYVSAGDKTQPGTYAVNVASAATQASVKGSSAVPTSGISSSETLTITSGSSSVNVSLASGSTVSTIVNDINSTLSSQGLDGITAVNDSGYLKLYTSQYGSGQSFSVVSNRSASGQSGIGTSTLTGTGTDVVATVGGQATTGNGQEATVSGSGPANGLKLKLTSSSTGNLGSVTVSSGLYQQLHPVLNNVLDPSNGAIAAAKDSINNTIDSLNNRISDLQKNVQSQKQLLQQQFNQMETTMAQLQQTGQYLTSYFGGGSGGGASKAQKLLGSAG